MGLLVFFDILGFVLCGWFWAGSPEGVTSLLLGAPHGVLPAEAILALDPCSSIVSLGASHLGDRQTDAGGSRESVQIVRLLVALGCFGFDRLRGCGLGRAAFILALFAEHLPLCFIRSK